MRENSDARIALAGIFHAEDATEHEEMPLGVAYLTSYLRSYGYDVLMLNIAAEEMRSSVEEIIQFNPSIFGVQVFDETMEAAITLTKTVKQRLPETFIVLGGRYASLDSYRILEHLEHVDSVVRGEGERTMLELAHALATGNDLSGINGLSHRQGSSIIENDARGLIVDLDSIPYPARDYMNMHTGRKARSVRIITSRGCVVSCSFCCVNPEIPLNRGKRWRGRSIKNVVDEIEFLVENFDAFFFNIHDSSFEDPGAKGKGRMIEFKDELKKRNLQISWKVNFRTETFTKDDRELIRELKQAGLDVVFLGIESGSNSDLAVMRKKATVEDNIRATLLFREENVFDIIGFIMYTPYTTLDDLKKNLYFLKLIDKTYCIYHFSNVLKAYRGSSIYRSLKEDGMITSDEDVKTPPQYKFIDARVEPIARAFSSIGGRFPRLLKINTLLYDAHNILSRYHNVMNEKCRELPEAYLEFKTRIFESERTIGDNYYQLFLSAIELAENGWNRTVFEILLEQHILDFLEGYPEKIESYITDYLNTIERAGISTDTLYLKTWSSYYSTGKHG